MTAKILKPQYEKMAVLLAGGMAVTAAAEELGVSAATGYRWASRPDVAARVQVLRGTATAAAISALRDSLGAAVATLAALMEDESTPASVRCSAAAKLLESAIKAIETEDIMRRIVALEKIHLTEE